MGRGQEEAGQEEEEEDAEARQFRLDWEAKERERKV